MRLPPPAPWRALEDIARDILKKLATAKKREKAANDG